MTTRKRTYLLTFLAVVLGIGLGVFFWYLPRLRVAWGSDHRPKATLLVSSQAQTIAFNTDESASSNSEASYRRFLKTQIALLKSPRVLSSALQYPGIGALESLKGLDDPLDWLAEDLEVTNPEETEVLEVALAAGSGANVADQAKLVNAIVHAFLDVVVNEEINVRKNRLETLKKLASTYRDLMKTRRETLRRLAAKAGGDDKSALVLRARLNLERRQELLGIQIKLRLEQVGTQALLERRKKAEDAATDLGRKEIVKLEDQLVALGAQQKFVQSELTQLEHSSVDVTDDTLDLSELQNDLTQIEESSRKINSELEKLNVELQAPPRIRIIEEAVPGQTEKGNLPPFRGQ